MRAAGKEVGRILLDLIGHGKDSGFYSKGLGKPLRDLKQDCNN